MGAKRQWLAMDTHYADSSLAVGIRERFGAIGVLVFDLFLRACKRNSVEGQVSYNSTPDFLALIGMPGLELRDETGEEWSLDTFWTYLGHMKNVSRTVRGRLTYVRSTRWERWQNPRSRPTDANMIPHDADVDKDKDKEKDISPQSPPALTVVEDPEVDEEIWRQYALKRLAQQPYGAVVHDGPWVAATAARAKSDLTHRAFELTTEYDLSTTQLVDALLAQSPPRWLNNCRRTA